MERYMISDTHFFDKSIIKFENRPFKSVEDMNKVMIDGWNYVVKLGGNESDTEIFVVGDFFADGTSEKDITDVIGQLKGKITLIRGNHDSDEMVAVYKKLGITVIDNPIILDGYFIVSHEPMYVSEQMPYANIFGHVHNNPMYKAVSTRSVCVCVERIGYKPISFDIIKQLIRQENTKE